MNMGIHQAEKANSQVGAGGAIRIPQSASNWMKTNLDIDIDELPAIGEETARWCLDFRRDLTNLTSAIDKPNCNDRAKIEKRGSEVLKTAKAELHIHNSTRLEYAMLASSSQVQLMKNICINY